MSGLPASLFTSTLQAWFVQSGASVFFVSSLGMISFVFFFRFFFGPLADKFYIPSLGRRKTWIMGTQILLFILIELMAFTNPSTATHRMIILAVILALLSAIQDLAIDAHRIEYLPVENYGYGAVIAVYACRLGILLSGGGALLYADSYGFAMTYACIGVLFLMGAVFVFFSREPIHQEPQLGQGPFQDFLQQPKLLNIIGLVIFIKCGEVFVANSSPIIISFMLQGLGLSLVKFAYVNKFFGLAAQLAGGFFAAFFIRRFPLLELLLCFGVLEILANLGFVILSLYPQHQALLWAAVAFENLASGLASTALVVFLMRLVNPSYAATQYTIWIMFAVLPRIIAGPMGGAISTHFGWPTLFGISSFLTTLFLGSWWQIKSSSELIFPRKVMSKVVEST